MTEARISPMSTEAEAIIREAREAVEIEIEGLRQVQSNLDAQFVRAVELILATQGRTVVTGIGKSGLIGRKIAATLASTGTPASFLHPVEAVHGDLGMVGPNDVIMAISNSGETQEVNALLPTFQSRSIPIIALTGHMHSTLARASQVVLNTHVQREACSLGLAPTASTAAALAVGDSLAVVLLRRRKFDERDFRKNHPAGTLGERLKVQVRQVMLTGSAIPLIRLGTKMQAVLKEIDSKRLGAALVLDGNEALVGIVTDGDLRRCMLRTEDLLSKAVDHIMTPNPKRVAPQALAADALALMERHLIMVLPVIGDDGQLLGMVHLHDLLGKGQFRFVV